MAKQGKITVEQVKLAKMQIIDSVSKFHVATSDQEIAAYIRGRMEPTKKYTEPAIEAGIAIALRAHRENQAPCAPAHRLGPGRPSHHPLAPEGAFGV